MVMVCIFGSPGQAADPFVNALTSTSIVKAAVVELTRLNDGILNVLAVLDSVNLLGADKPIGTEFIFQKYVTSGVNDEKRTSREFEPEHMDCAFENGSLIDGAGFTVNEKGFVSPIQLAAEEVTE